MRVKGIIIDIDNTLYPYDLNHKRALNSTFNYMQTIYDKDLSELMLAYNQARFQIHVELSETASSHNRLLYFQRMLEILGENALGVSLDLYQLYWDSFIEEIEPFEGVFPFLESLESCKVCLLTDLTADIQHRKIKKLGLEKYADYIVTSEEAGKEKPHPYMFLLALEKMKLLASEVIMIGDSYEKDYIGARNLGIKSYLFHPDKKDKPDDSIMHSFNNYHQLVGVVS